MRLHSCVSACTSHIRALPHRSHRSKATSIHKPVFDLFIAKRWPTVGLRLCEKGIEGTTLQKKKITDRPYIKRTSYSIRVCLRLRHEDTVVQLFWSTCVSEKAKAVYLWGDKKWLACDAIVIGHLALVFDIVQPWFGQKVTRLLNPSTQVNIFWKIMAQWSCSGTHCVQTCSAKWRFLRQMRSAVSKSAP